MTSTKLFCAAALLLTASSCIHKIHAQSAALTPTPKFTALDNNGHPIAGGCLFTYQAGSSTPQNTFTDSTGGVANSNPVQMDSAGRANVWLTAAAYKFVLYNAPSSGSCSPVNYGSLVWSVDQISANNLLSGSITVPNGSTFAMASGSTFVSSTELAPSAANTYDLGDSTHQWRKGYINALALNGAVTQTANNANDLGALTTAFRGLYGFNSFVNVANLCGVNGGSTLSSPCFTLNPTIDASNTFLTLKDTSGAIIWKWTELESSSATNYIGAGLTLRPLADAFYNLGTPSFRWLNLNVSGVATVGTLEIVGQHLGTTGAAPNDIAGSIAISSATSAAQNFNQTWLFAPTCTLTPQSDPGALTYWVSSSTTAVTAHLSGSGTITFNYHCFGQPL
jgi:hypothetical protein